MELKLPREGSAFWFVTLPTLPVIFAFLELLCCSVVMMGSVFVQVSNCYIFSKPNIMCVGQLVKSEKPYGSCK